MKATSADRTRSAGFTLLELVVAITLFALVIITVLGDREDSIRMSADARVVQTVQYLTSTKLDEIRHDPDRLGDSESGDFEEIETDWQKFGDFSWEFETEKMVVIGKTTERDASYLFPEDEEETAPANADGKAYSPRYVRRARLTVLYTPNGERRPDLSVVVETYLPPAKEDEPKQETPQ